MPYLRIHDDADISSKKMYDFFMSLKQPDGSFLVSHHGEVDVRYVQSQLRRLLI